MSWSGDFEMLLAAIIDQLRDDWVATWVESSWVIMTAEKVQWYQKQQQMPVDV